MRKYLIHIRQEKNLTQEQAARLAGLSRQYYNMIEIGARQKDMGIQMASKLAGALGVSVEYILQQEQALAPKAG